MTSCNLEALYLVSAKSVFCQQDDAAVALQHKAYNYHRWKEEYEEVIWPRFTSSSEQEKLLALKSCLSIKREVSNVCMKMERLWPTPWEVLDNI